jgi:hypothetical protein
MKIQISNLSKFKTVLCFSLIWTSTLSASYTYSQCNSSYYLNTANLACVTCPNNQIANTYQVVPTACQCSVGYIPSTNGACSVANTSSCSTSNSYYPVYNRDGSSNSAANCLACAGNAYVNKYKPVYLEMGPDVLLVGLE